MRASALAALVALAGCRAPTSVDVTVTFDGAVQPDHLSVDVALGGAPLRTGATVTAPGGRALHSGDDFVIALPDSAGGQMVEVAVTAFQNGAAVRSGNGQLTVTAHRESSLTIDLLGACVASCVNGVANVCTDGGAAMQQCAFGCAGAACNLADNCASPGDVSQGGSFAGSTAGLANDGDGSCAPNSGPDLVTQVTLTDWRTVTFDTSGSDYATALYTRTACANSSSEFSLAGPCPGAVNNVSATTCNKAGMASSLVECGLPPGTYFTWLDSVSVGGNWKLKVTTTPVDVNSCAGAGHLIGLGSFPAVDTTTHADHFQTASNQCTSTGAGARDATFYLVVPAQRNYTFSTAKGFRHMVYVRNACNAADLACAETQVANKGVTLAANLAPGLYFVIVDGLTAGDFGNIVLTVQ